MRCLNLSSIFFISISSETINPYEMQPDYNKELKAAEKEKEEETK